VVGFYELLGEKLLHFVNISLLSYVLATYYIGDTGVASKSYFLCR